MNADQVNRLIGLPWVSGARGPCSFDCWGLVYFVYREYFGIELPQFPGIKEIGLFAVARLLKEGTTFGGDWTEINQPVHGCGVAMGFNRRLHHVGVWLDLDGGLVLHAAETSRVAAARLSDLRKTGINQVVYYRHSRCKTA